MSTTTNLPRVESLANCIPARCELGRELIARQARLELAVLCAPSMGLTPEELLRRWEDEGR